MLLLGILDQTLAIEKSMYKTPITPVGLKGLFARIVAHLYKFALAEQAGAKPNRPNDCQQQVYIKTKFRESLQTGHGAGAIYETANGKY
jgi:hypothetical protein